MLKKAAAFTFALSFVLCMCVCGEPDSEITISLGGSRSADSRAERVAKEPLSRSRTSGNKEKIGVYGVVISDFAVIRKTPSSKAVSRGMVPVNETLIIQTEKAGFSGVLLEDGTIGWIDSSCVKTVPVEVFAKRTYVPTGLRGYDSTKVPYSEIIIHSLAFTHTPYVFGGTSPSSGMDCSAFVREIFKRLGVTLPRTAREQATVGTDVPRNRESMQVGDRVYFRYKNSYIDHTGIYVGNGYYVHCNSNKNGVSCDDLFAPRTYSKLVAVRRL